MVHTNLCRVKYRDGVTGKIGMWDSWPVVIDEYTVNDVQAVLGKNKSLQKRNFAAYRIQL